MFRRTLATLAIVGMVFASGCAEEQPMIDRTEANALSKSLFTGEWWFNQTVVDAPNHQLPSFIPVGSVNYSGAKRIRWEIQENWLYARKSYEHIKGAQRETVYGDVTNGSGDDMIDEQTGEFKGSIVGAWRISSHFDIRRQYNATTGQEMNVLMEIASDCKWYNCKYFRVDWSQNMAVDYLFMDYDEDIQKQPMPFYYQDAEDPRWTPVFDQKNGYIDVTTAMALDPGKVRFSWGGRTYSYPLCWLFGSETAECNSITIKLRNSFWRRPANHDYQPRQHFGEITEWFGFFTNDRLMWDNRFGTTEKIRQQVINRHNVWEKWHRADKACTTNDDCKDQPGSECDTMLKFFTVDTETDTDFDGLPDSFEELAGLNKANADSNGDKVLDRNGDKVSLKISYDAETGKPNGVTVEATPDGMPDIQNYWKWASLNKEHRCTIPMKDRIPRPTAYFNTGYFPRDMVCDSDDPNKQGFCKAWVWDKDVKVRESGDSRWSVVHQVSNNYDDTFWRIYLRGAYGWSQAKLDKWIETRNPKDAMFTDADREVLGRFGDINDPTGKNGLYAFTICANNPPQADDPWPCRFNKMSWPQAKAAIEAGKDTAENRPLVRRGDIRFSQINYVAGYSQGLLGLGPSHTDPITGENFAGVANVYHLNDVAANSVREMVGLLNGTISTTDYVDGVDLQKWADTINFKARAGAKTQAIGHAQIKSGYKATVQPWMKRIPRSANVDLMAAHRTQSNSQIKMQLISHMNKLGLFDPAKASVPGLAVLKGSPLEKRLIDNEVLQGSGYGPDQAPELTDDVLNNASIARGGWIKLAAARDQWQSLMSQRHNMFFEDMVDDAMVGLATRLKDKTPEEVFKVARRVIMRAVLTHEMGHTFGLHHNWAGSEDVINFFPQYWRLRTSNFTETKRCTGPWTRDWENNFGQLLSNTPAPKAGDGKLCPFFIKPMTDYQKGIDQKSISDGLRPMHEYSYSSIMDYAGRYTIDGHGLGKYDKAAIMYGHVDKMEVYDNSPINDAGKVTRSLENWMEQWREGDGSATIFYTFPKAFHYTNWWSYFEDATGDGAKMFQDSNRLVVDYRDIKQLTTSEGRELGFFYRDGNKLHPRVPYLFCTYTSGDISDNCNTRDFGADQYERMKNYLDGWDSYYPLRSFTRYRYGMSPSSYIRRHYRRTYLKMKDFNNAYALYQGLFRTFTTEEATTNFFQDVSDGWASYTLALNNGFDMALRTLAMPDIKNFADDTTPDGQAIYNEMSIGTPAMKPGVTNGRYFTTSYSTGDFKRTCGLKWWQCLHHIGFYTDKVMSLLAISDARTYFVGQDTSEDIREYRISFFDNYSTQLVDFFGSVLSNEYDTHAPWYNRAIADKPVHYDAQGNEWRYGLAWRRYADKTQDIAKGPGVKAVEPATRFTLKMYLMVMGMLRFENNFDKSFTNRGAMWKKGSMAGWDITPTDTVNGTTEFLDPFTGQTYIGADYKDGRGIAQKMIAYANRLKARSKYCNSTDTTAADYCQPGLSPQSKQAAESALWDYIQLMEVMSDLTTRYLNWGNWGWNPFNP